jgi:hypothetical protein
MHGILFPMSSINVIMSDTAITSLGNTTTFTAIPIVARNYRITFLLLDYSFFSLLNSSQGAAWVSRFRNNTAAEQAF